jgi:hypothetical protein
MSVQIPDTPPIVSSFSLIFSSQPNQSGFVIESSVFPTSIVFPNTHSIIESSVVSQSSSLGNTVKLGVDSNEFALSDLESGSRLFWPSADLIKTHEIEATSAVENSPVFTSASFVPSTSVRPSYRFGRSVRCWGSSHPARSAFLTQSDRFNPIAIATPSVNFDHLTELHNSNIYPATVLEDSNSATLMISSQFSESINHKRTNLIQDSLAHNSYQFPQSRSIQSSDSLLDSVFLHRSSAFSESVLRWWTTVDQPSDIYDQTARLLSVQFDGSVTALNTPIFQHSPTFCSVPFFRSDLLYQSAAFIESIVPSHSSRFARTNHFLTTDPLRFANSPTFIESFRFQFSNEISQSAVLNSSPILRRTNVLLPSSIVRETRARGNSASFIVSLTPIQLTQIASLSVRLIASSILPDLPLTSPFKPTTVIACIKLVISDAIFSPRFVASRDPQATLLLNSDALFDDGGFKHSTRVSEAQGAEGQERTGSSTSGVVWIGIIVALSILLLLIVFLIIAWRHGQTKTDEIDVAYDIETEFKEEAVQEPDTTLDYDDSLDLDFANSLARRSDVDLDPDEFGTGGDESVFPF